MHVSLLIAGFIGELVHWTEVLAGLLSPLLAGSTLLARSSVVRKVLRAIIGNPSRDSIISMTRGVGRKSKL